MCVNTDNNGDHFPEYGIGKTESVCHVHYIAEHTDVFCFSLSVFGYQFWNHSHEYGLADFVIIQKDEPERQKSSILVFRKKIPVINAPPPNTEH